MLVTWLVAVINFANKSSLQKEKFILSQFWGGVPHGEEVKAAGA